MSEIYSCKNCSNRTIRCHSYCEKYKKEKELNDKHRVQMRLDSYTNRAIVSSDFSTYRGKTHKK